MPSSAPTNQKQTKHRAARCRLPGTPLPAPHCHNHQAPAKASLRIPPSVFVKVNIHSLLCSFPEREYIVFTRIARVVITTGRFPFLEIDIATHSTIQAHAERVAIARERPAHLSVPTSEELQKPIGSMDV